MYTKVEHLISYYLSQSHKNETVTSSLTQFYNISLVVVSTGKVKCQKVKQFD